jgi:transcriptional regulator with XRE-family HTH domain
MQNKLQEKYNSVETPSKRLVHLLKMCGLNQPELAKKLPYNVSTINRWISGETSSINSEKRKIIAKVMGFDLQWIEEGVHSISANEQKDYKNLTNNKFNYIAKEVPIKTLNPSEKEELVNGLEKELNELFKKFNRVRRSNIDYDTRNLAYEGALNMIEDTFRKFSKARHGF